MWKYAVFSVALYFYFVGKHKAQEDTWATECGVSRYDDAGVNQNLFQIVNGWEARIHEFPWMAAVRHLGDHECGAVIINSRWVMTAAHCLDDGEEADELTVRVGDHDFENPNPDLLEVPVEMFILHEDYGGSGSSGSDIALVKMVEDIPNYENVTAACKPSGDYGGAYGSASGWGRLESGGDSATVLNYVNNPVLDQEECFDCLSDYIIPGMLCWGYCGSNNRSTCNGDSGGPLSIKGDDGLFQVIGLTSFNVGGCVSDNPKVFTNVTHFVPWIEERMLEFSDANVRAIFN